MEKKDELKVSLLRKEEDDRDLWNFTNKVDTRVLLSDFHGDSQTNTNPTFYFPRFPFSNHMLIHSRRYRLMDTSKLQILPFDLSFLCFTVLLQIECNQHIYLYFSCLIRKLQLFYLYDCFSCYPADSRSSYFACFINMCFSADTVHVLKLRWRQKVIIKYQK